MSGHNKWTQIKHQKGITDLKRGKLFSKVLQAISAAAKQEPDPKFNPRLRTAILKAKESNISNDAIERAIGRASGGGDDLSECIFGAYDKNGVALIIEVATDNKNRTASEVKKTLNSHGAKWAETGSVLWVFEQSGNSWKPRSPQILSSAEKEELARLAKDLESCEDVRAVVTNGAP